MSEAVLSKGACQQCGGHIAFPPEGAGRRIECPHCGHPTVLEAARGPARKRPGRGCAIGPALVVVAAGGLLAYKQIPGDNLGGGARPSLIPDPPPPDLQRIEAMAFWEIRLEQTEGSRLEYVVARVLNESSRRRYGVRVEFELRNEAGEAVASATDYLDTLDPGEDAYLRALVVASAAHSAVVKGITEQ